MGVVLIFFFLWLWTPLSTAFLAFRALDLASVLAGTAKMEKLNFVSLMIGVSQIPMIYDKLGTQKG